MKFSLQKTTKVILFSQLKNNLRNPPQPLNTRELPRCKQPLQLQHDHDSQFGSSNVCEFDLLGTTTQRIESEIQLCLRKTLHKIFFKAVQPKRYYTWSPALAERDTAFAFALESLPAFPPAYEPDRIVEVRVKNMTRERRYQFELMFNQLKRKWSSFSGEKYDEIGSNQADASGFTYSINLPFRSSLCKFV